MHAARRVAHAHRRLYSSIHQYSTLSPCVLFTPVRVPAGPQAGRLTLRPLLFPSLYACACRSASRSTSSRWAPPRAWAWWPPTTSPSPPATPAWTPRRPASSRWARWPAGSTARPLADRQQCPPACGLSAAPARPPARCSVSSSARPPARLHACVPACHRPPALRLCFACLQLYYAELRAPRSAFHITATANPPLSGRSALPLLRC